MDRAIAILFATHNGARTLPRMIAALERLEAPARPWRIVAVDNASTDETAQILADAATRLPMTVVGCPIPGKLPALKMGAQAVTGDLVVFTDDDVEPVPGWLSAYEAAADAHPEAGFFGGPITPLPLEPLSPWYEVSEDFHGELFARSRIEDGPIDPEDDLFGPNFMLRREHLDVLDATPDWIGPTFEAGKAKSFPLCDDTAIMMAASAKGLTARGVAAARVNHLVRGFQTDLKFMLERAQRHGRGWATHYLGAKGPTLKRRLGVIGKGLAGGLVPPKPEVATPDPTRFGKMWKANWLHGAAIGAAFGPFAKTPERPPIS
jgi:glucosyl-dolichyl phosphate glucuronosyltransferase